MFFRFPGIRSICGLTITVLLALSEVACNSYGYNPSTTGVGVLSGNDLRAFVSNPVHPSLGNRGTPALEVVDATTDLLTFSFVNLASLTGNVGGAGAITLSPKRDRSIVISPPDDRLAVVDNATQSVVTVVSLPGLTQSVFFGTDDTTAYAAVPTAPVMGQLPGAVERIDSSSGSITATIPVPASRFVIASPSGNQVLVLSDNSNAVTVLTPSVIGTGPQSPMQPCSATPAVVCTVSGGGLDHPIGAVFNPSGTTAYIISCGPECGGTTASISVLNMGSTSTPPSFTGQSALVPGGVTVAFLQGTTLYVAGTPPAPQNDCASVTPSTAATSCGKLTVINTSSMTASAPVEIPDGFHTNMQMGTTGQLFIGSTGCTNLNVAGGEVRGCLAIVDTTSGALAAANVIAPPDNGDVTGIEPIPNRNVVYVCEGGRLRFYDTTTDKLKTRPAQPDVVGQAVDVKVVDF